MTAKYYAILTTLGAAKLANATALGTKLDITTMAVGDGGGTLPTPDASQTAIVGEKRRAPINMLNTDPANPGQIIAEQIIPENEGGFWIRTIGLYDKDGTLIAVANCPETYKPLLQEGSGRTQTIRMVLLVSGTDNITLKIDPAVVLATRKYVDDVSLDAAKYVVSMHKQEVDPHPQYATDSDVNAAVSAAIAAKFSQYLGRYLGLLTFYQSGTYVPSPGAKKIKVTMTAGGASGGKSSIQGNFARGGGAGGTVIAWLDVPDSAVSVYIGAGGVGVSTAGSAGNPGGNTLFGDLLAAYGGTTNSGLGGGAVNAGISIHGGNGSVGASTANLTFGGASHWGGGGAGYNSAVPETMHARAHGSGGAGTDSTGVTSGSGAPGICFIEEYA